MINRFIGIVLFSGALLGCVGTRVQTEPVGAPAAAVIAAGESAVPPVVIGTLAAPGEMNVEQKMNETLRAPGPGVYLRLELDGADISTARVRPFSDGLRRHLAGKGFKPADAVATAGSELTVTSFEQGARRGVVLEWGLRRERRRPVRWFRQIYSVSEPFAKVWPVLEAKIFAGLDALELPIDPGAATPPANCAPRFGFDADARGRVRSVVPRGPAQRADLRAGDVIRAIDSEAPAPDRPDVTADVYEQRLLVPLKIDRGGQVIRTVWRAELVCE